MKTKTAKSRLSISVTSLLLCTSAGAGDFRFELRAGFEAERLSTAIPLFGGFPEVPDSTVFLDTDTDAVAVSGSWYFSGASDADGPMSRAVFLSRASSVDFAYRRTDVDTSIAIDPPLQLLPAPGFPPPPPDTIIRPAPGPVQPDFDGDEYSIGGRYVWTDSGWYVFGSASFGDSDVGEGAFSGSIETRRLTAGGGIYVGERTALEVAVLDTNVDISLGETTDSDSATDFAVSITHIGNLGATWQFGVDAAVISRDRSGSDTSTALRGSLYPTRAVAFGLEFESEVDAVFDDGTRYSIFGSWFVTPNVEVFGRYGQVDLDPPPGSTADLDLFSLGLSGRF